MRDGEIKPGKRAKERGNRHAASRRLDARRSETSEPEAPVEPEPGSRETNHAHVPVSFDDPGLYLNRELSWLEFNNRVLQEALNESNPLLERVKYLCIFSSNLDEFFEIRVAGLQQQREMKTSEYSPDGLNASQQLSAISKKVQDLVAKQYRCWREDLVPEMRKRDIHFLTYPDVDAKAEKFLERYFENEVFPVLTPLAIDPVHPFPNLLNKSLNVVVELHGRNLSTNLAIVQVPRILPRVVALPDDGRGVQRFVFIGNLIQHHVGRLFHGVKVKGAHQFRITRNSDLYIDEEEADNLLRSIEAELRSRNRGNAVRLEVQDDCPQSVVRRLLRTFMLQEDDCYRVDGPINFTRLFPVIADIDRPELKFKRFTPYVAPALNEAKIFQQIRAGDILLHHPYDSFEPVTQFVELAASDPDVLAIKQTLYRTSGDTPLVPALISAAENGKQVTVVIELKARFDEAANIKWARILQDAGVHVVYGLVGMKTHCKLALVVRRELEGIKRYAHLGTGNYHPSTARLYTDFGMFTCRPDLTGDCAELFNLLTGVSKFPGMNKLVVAPFTLHDRMVELVEREAENAKAGRPSGITARMNALVDQEIIESLYRASCAGVPVKLLVRGICVLKPGVPGVSENIEVRSVVGRFLEHSRVFCFENAGSRLIYLSSADWMPRNFYRRVETCFPVEDPALRDQVEEAMKIYWLDNVKSSRLLPNGAYERVDSDDVRISAQDELLMKRSAEPRLLVT
jgi:polyphosphate kinase